VTASVLSDTVTKTLLKLNIDANELKDYRENGTVYAEKCAEVFERIQTALDSQKIRKFSDDQAGILKSINKTIAMEEQFARSSFKARSPDAWRDFLND
jgi:hypothetical protein